MDRAVVSGPPGTVVRRLLRTAADEIIVTANDADVLEAAIAATAERVEGTPRTVRLLATESAAEAASRDFLTASRAVDLVEESRLSFHTADRDVLTSLVVSREAIACLFSLRGNEVGAIRVRDDAFALSVRGAYLLEISRSPPFEVSVPPYSRVLETLGETLGEDTRSDVSTALESAGTARSDEDGLDELDVFLLMAARNGREVNELYRWGDENGIASRATFSNRKQRLEDAGLVAAETVKGGVGRPRQRLQLASETLRGAAPGDVLSAARSVLAT